VCRVPISHKCVVYLLRLIDAKKQGMRYSAEWIQGLKLCLATPK
jgi:hypothetical protein